MSRRFRRAPGRLRRRTLPAFAVLAGACALAGHAAAAPPSHAPARTTASPSASGTVIGLQPGADARAVAAALREAGIATRPMRRLQALMAPGVDADAVRRALGRDGRVRWVEQTVTRSLLVAEPSSSVDASTGRPFDWAYTAVDAGPALALAGGGSSVKVAVVDTGVDATQPDLAGRVGPAVDIAFDQATAPDLVGHGTFVAGLISAIDGNGIGSRGVAGATTILPFRITTATSVTDANSAEGIAEAVDSGARVVNLSYGGDSISAAERAALEYAASKDVLIVAAAGNSRQQTSPPNPVIYPAAAVGGFKGGWSAGISVGAVDPNGNPAPFSTSNDAVTVSAPGAGSTDDCGDGVFSTIPQNEVTLWKEGTCLRTTGSAGSAAGRYGYAEGTSFAAPLVAGAAALVRGVNPKLTAPQTADVIRRTARQTYASGWNSRTGAGQIDMDAAVVLARRYDTTAPTPTIAASPVAGGVSLVVTVKDAASSGAEQSAMMSVHLESSADGASFAAVAPDVTGTLRATDAAGPGAKRWYRATACDVNRNCATTTTGPVAAGPASKASAAGIGPALTRVSVGRPKACKTCLAITFTASGKGPLTWGADISGAGVKLLRKSGSVASGRRKSITVRLSRLPVCGGRLSVALRLTSASGLAKTAKGVPVTTRCSTARATSKRTKATRKQTVRRPA